MQGEEEIFCDEQSRYDMMTRVYKGRLIPLLVVFCALIIPQFILNLFVYHNYGIAVLYGMIFALYGTVFVSCMKKRKEFRDRLGS